MIIVYILSAPVKQHLLILSVFIIATWSLSTNHILIKVLSADKIVSLKNYVIARIANLAGYHPR